MLTPALVIVFDFGNILYWAAIIFGGTFALGVLLSALGVIFPDQANRNRQRLQCEDEEAARLGPEAVSALWRKRYDTNHDDHMWSAKVWGFIEYNGFDWCAASDWDEKLRDYQMRMSRGY